MDMVFIACWSKLKQMSNQLQIESYRISMRKLRTFYWKVTEFLNDDKIMRLQRLAAVAINTLYWRAERCGYLYRFTVYLCIYHTSVIEAVGLFKRHVFKTEIIVFSSLVFVCYRLCLLLLFAKIVQTECRTTSLLDCFAEVQPILCKDK